MAMATDRTDPAAARAGTGEPVGDARPADKASAGEKTLLVLEAALRHDRFTDVVEATGLAKATTHRILATLVERGYVALGQDGGYLPGPQILSLAGHALQRIDISAIAQPFVDQLVDEVHCTGHLGVANGDEIVYLIRTDSDKPYQMPSRVGHAIPMHSSGIGKTVLAGWTDEEIERFVARTGLPRRTEHTVTTLEGLRSELAAVRERGYALDCEENVPGVVCVAAPVRDHTGAARYGVSISTLALEYSPQQLEAFAPVVMETAAQISAALGHSPGRG